MNHKSLIIRYLSAMIAVFSVGCAAGPMSNSNATTTGGAVGAVAGSVLGGVIGHQSGRAGEGALAGGVIGGAYGAQNGSRWFGGDGSIQSTEREGQ